MRSTWSGLAKDWKGFQPVGYFFDDLVLKIPLKCERDGKANSESGQMPLGELLQELNGRNFRISDDLLVRFTVSIGESSICVSGLSFNVNLARIILELVSEGRSLYQTRWFCYAKASCLTEPHDRYEFFVTEGEEIIRDSVALSDYPSNGFDPHIFESFDHSEPSWDDEEAWRSAIDASLYRKFYSTTRMGQLMVLRPDRPPLHCTSREATVNNTFPHSAHSDLKTPLWLIGVLLAVIALLMVVHR